MPMRRRLFSLASLVSLLLCVATVVLWVRGYWFHEWFLLHFEGTEKAYMAAIQSGSGGISVEFGRAFLRREVGAVTFEHITHSDAWYPIPGFDGQCNSAGFFFGISSTLPLRCCFVLAPQWFVAPFLMIAPLISVRRVLRCRGRCGLCPKCNYNLL